MCQADNKSSFREPGKVHLLAAYSATLLLQQYLGTLNNFDGGKQYVTFSILKGSSMLSTVHHNLAAASWRVFKWTPQIPMSIQCWPEWWRDLMVEVPYHQQQMDFGQTTCWPPCAFLKSEKWQWLPLKCLDLKFCDRRIPHSASFSLTKY